MLPIALLVIVFYCLHLLLLCLREAPRLLAPTAAGAGVGLHLLLAGMGVFQPGGMHLDLLSSLSAVFALTLAGRHLFLRLTLPRLVDAALVAMALGLVILQVWLPNGRAFNHDEGWAFGVHIIIAIAAYVCLALAAVLAMTLWIADRHLHRSPSSRLAQTLPPLLTLENRLFQLLGVGFVLLSVTLLSGVLFSEQLFGRPPALLSHKIVFSVLAWMVFAVLLFGRVRHGWRGRVAATWSLTGFVFLMIAYVGTKFVLEVLLHRL